MDNNNLINLIYNAKNGNLDGYQNAIVFGEDGSLRIKGQQNNSSFSKVYIPADAKFTDTIYSADDIVNLLKTTDRLNELQGAQGNQGIQGTQGNKGIQGDNGIQGNQGTQGNRGIQGENGIQGKQGHQGNRGIQGDNGIQGNQGTQGNRGIQGENGIQGKQGHQGNRGIQGENGIQGKQGHQGNRGIQGYNGIQGKQGHQGATGNKGPQGSPGSFETSSFVTLGTAQTITGQKTLTNALTIKGVTDTGQYSQGGFNKAYSNIILQGDNTYGVSGITLLSKKSNDTSINTPSDVAFIQYHPYGVQAQPYNTTPIEAPSGEKGRFVIGIGNDTSNTAHCDRVEPDDSRWIHIAHHNNPGNGKLFSKTDKFAQGVFLDDDRWFNIYAGVQNLSSFEFLVVQKTTSTATETKYRWTQTKSPLTAKYNDVAPSAVTRITTSGYTNGAQGGLYILNNDYTYMSIADGNSGDWFGAFGAYTPSQNGIPGYPNTFITSGYIDLYVRIPGTNGTTGDELWLQTSGHRDLIHYVANKGYEILDAYNYTDVTVSKTGAGASGTWDINISGNADTVNGYHANNLHNAISYVLTTGNSAHDYIRMATFTATGSGLCILKLSIICMWTEVGSDVNLIYNGRSSFILNVSIRSTKGSSTEIADFTISPIGRTLPPAIYLRTNDHITYYLYIAKKNGLWNPYYNAYPLRNECTNGTCVLENMGVKSADIITGTAGAWTPDYGIIASMMNNLYTSRPTSANLGKIGDGMLRQFKATSAMSQANGHPSHDSHILHFEWDNDGGYSAQLAIPTVASGSDRPMRFRGQNTDGTWGIWKILLDNDNYDSYMGFVPANIGVKNTVVDLHTATNNLSSGSKQYPGFRTYDKNNYMIGQYINSIYSDGSINMRMSLRQYSTTAGSDYLTDRGISYTLSQPDASNNITGTWDISDPEAFRTAISAASTSHSHSLAHTHSQYATTSHSHSQYLVKAGDTMSGTLSMVANKIYWKENNYGDQFAIMPQFSGTDDANKLQILSAVGGQGTTPDMTPKVTILGKTGKVGILNDAPSYTLDVSGNMRLDGFTGDAISLNPSSTSTWNCIAYKRLTNENVINTDTCDWSTGILSSGFYVWNNSNTSGQRVLLITNGCKIGVGTDSPTGKVHINTALTSKTEPILRLTENGALSDRRLLWGLSTNLGGSQSTEISLGKAASSKNLGQLVYTHVEDASNNNHLSLGFYGVGNNLSLYANGNVRIGNINNTAPSHKLYVTGTTCLTGNISYAGTKATYEMIKFIDNTYDGNGNGIAIGGGGATIIGGGESVSTMIPQLSSTFLGGEERLMFGNDANVEIYSNLQNGFTNRHSLILDNAGKLTLDSKVQLWKDGEGGNIRIYAPDSYTYYTNSSGNTANLFWEMDAYNGDLRFYSYDNDGTSSKASTYRCVSINRKSSIVRNTQATSTYWYQGRDYAFIKDLSTTGYHPLWSMKTKDGSWEFGEHNNSAAANVPVMTYITDTNYNNSTNTCTYQIKFPLATGTIALTSDLSHSHDGYATTGHSHSQYATTSHSHSYASTSHSHNYVLKSGDTMTGMLTNDLNGSPTTGTVMTIKCGHTNKTSPTARSLRAISITDKNNVINGWIEYVADTNGNTSLGLYNVQDKSATDSGRNWAGFIIRRTNGNYGNYNLLYNANNGQLQNAAPDGTEPFTVVSKTLVTNLNADMLDGYHSSSFASSSHSHSNYLTSAGLSYAHHNAVGTVGTAGWVKIANITITSTYKNQSLIFFIGQRGKHGGILFLNFTNFSSINDANIDKLVYIGSMTAVKINGSGSSWQLYIQKSESYDNIAISLYNYGSYLYGGGLVVSLVDEHYSSVPTSGTTKTATEYAPSYAAVAGTAYDSDQLSGYNWDDFALASHSHNYASTSHNHGSYYLTSLPNHSHNYASTSHSHSYAATVDTSNNIYILGSTSTSNVQSSLYFSASSGSSLSTSYVPYMNKGLIYSPSDERIKDNIKPVDTELVDSIFDNDIDLIKQYDLKANGNHKYGFIAQELLEYVPEAVIENKDDGMMGVDYNTALSAMVGILFKKVKQQEETINRQEKMINDLYNIIMKEKGES